MPGNKIMISEHFDHTDIKAINQTSDTKSSQGQSFYETWVKKNPLIFIQLKFDETGRQGLVMGIRKSFQRGELFIKD